jgi:hypothetical protein
VATSAGPAGWTSHQSGSDTLTASAAQRVLPTDDPPTSSTNPPRCAAAVTRARTPNSAVSASRSTYSGGTSSGTPGTLIAACTPSRRMSASLTRTAPGGRAVPVSRAWLPALPAEVMPKAASLAAIMAANCCGVRVRRSTATIPGTSPGRGVSSNRAGSTYTRRSRTALFSAALRSSRVQSRAAYSAEMNTTTAAVFSP